MKIIFLLLVIRLVNAKLDLLVGGIFYDGNDEREIAFTTAIEISNIENIGNFKMIPIIKYANENTNSFVLQNIVCELISEGVVAIFGCNAPRSGIISAICNTLGIPHFIFDYEREFRSFQKEFYMMSISVYPNDLVFGRAYSAIIKSLSWDNYAILYETDRDILQLQDMLQIQGAKNKPLILRRITEKSSDYRPLLKYIREMHYPYIIIHCSNDKILSILQQAYDLNMMGEYQSFFLATLDTHTINFGLLNFTFQANITGVRLTDPTDYNVQNIVIEWEQRQKKLGKYFRILPSEIKTSMLVTNDAVRVFAKGVSEMNISTIYSDPIGTCRNKKSWPLGRQIIENIKDKFAKNRQEFTTGPMDFDQYGQRSFFRIKLFEINNKENIDIAEWDPVKGVQRKDDGSDMRREEKFQTKTFIISSRIGEPFLFNRSKYILNETLVGNNRYEGYSMDLIDELAKRIGFKYEFRLAADGNYGALNKKTGKWDGIMRDVIDGKADLGLCDLTITSTRRDAVDFTPPFMNLGISLLFVEPKAAEVNLWSFIDPFSTEVWVRMGVWTFSIMILVLIASRMAPADWENPQPDKTHPEELETVWTLPTSFWLSVGSLIGMGSDFLPKAISTRVITGVWWFFALTMINSYTANLAAFLTKSNSGTNIKSIQDLANQKLVKYGTLLDGSTMDFFRNSNESLYQKMWSSMEVEDPKVFEKDNSFGEARVNSSKGKYAYFMESSILEYKIERNCRLIQVGKWLDFKTYGIAMPFNSPYRKKINEVMLRLGESGVLADLKRRWWKEKFVSTKCERSAETTGPSRLAMQNVGGVFLVLGMGLFVSHIIGWIDFFWKAQKIAVAEKISMFEAIKSEISFAAKFWLTTKPVNTDNSTANSISLSNSSNKTFHGSEFSLKKLFPIKGKNYDNIDDKRSESSKDKNDVSEKNSKYKLNINLP